MQILYDAIACGLLTSLTWLGLVWILPSSPVSSGRAWVQGVGIVAIANIFIWIALVGLNLRLVPVWIIAFLLMNVAIARLAFPFCEGLQIPPLWAMAVHPILIASMAVLLGGQLASCKLLGVVRDRLTCYQRRFAQELTPSESQKITDLIHKVDSYSIAIAVFGKVSTGKTSLINALLGERLGATGALNGVTQDAITYSWQPSSQKIKLQLIDTQGIDEINGATRAAIALDAAKQADLVLFVIAGNISRIEQEAIAQLQNLAKPILLVFNKADLYTKSDQQAILKSLSHPELARLIAPSEIIVTVAEPQPVKVLGRWGNQSQEIWEKPQPDLQALKLRILELLNAEGKSLLAINVLRSLLEIEEAVVSRYVQGWQWRSIAAPLFVITAIALLRSPWQWLDAAITATTSSIWALTLVNKYALSKKYGWAALIVAIAILTGMVGSDRGASWWVTAKHIIEILIVGASLSILSFGILQDIATGTTSNRPLNKSLGEFNTPEPYCCHSQCHSQCYSQCYRHPLNLTPPQLT